MEEKPKEFNSISAIFLFKTINFLHDSLSKLCSDPLFSSIVTLYTLILLYIPPLFLKIIFSPIFISTGILFLTLLRLGAVERVETEFKSNSSSLEDQDHNPEPDSETGSGRFQAIEKEFNSSSTDPHEEVHDHKVVSRGTGSDRENEMGSRSGWGLDQGIGRTEKDFNPNPNSNSNSTEPQQEVLESEDQDHKWVLLESSSEPESKMGLGRFQAVERTEKESHSTESQEEILDSEDQDYKWVSLKTGSEPDNETGLDSVLRSGSHSNEPQQEVLDSRYECHKWVSIETDSGSDAETGSGLGRGSVSRGTFYNVGAPLEIIYEDYGEEEEANDDVSDEKNEKRVVGIERCPSLSMYYPESDGDSSSDEDFPLIGNWDSPERVFFKWDEDEREELIEIGLGDGRRRFQLEEENLIEIDISPSRKVAFSG